MRNVLQSSRRRLICVFCLESFLDTEIRFRCRGAPGPGGTTCQAIRDDRIHLATGRTVWLPPTFSADGRKNRATCPSCRQETNRRACPRCHHELPSGFGRLDSRMISVVGTSGSGKTTFVTVLLNELQNRVGERLDTSILSLNDRTLERLYDNQHRLYTAGQTFDPTNWTVRRGQIEPLAFRMATTRRRLSGTRASHSLFSVYDMAGQELDVEARARRNARCLVRANGVILLLDPWRLRDGSQLGALRRVTRLLEDALNRRPPDRIEKHIAVVVSKLDELRDTLPEGSALAQPQREAGGLDVADGGQVHDQVRDLLGRLAGKELDELLQQRYSRHRYFALSALGERPRPEDGRVGSVRPQRVADPLLWLLRELNAVPAARARRVSTSQQGQV